ncbi:hypothetical protein QF028_004414 [Neobacillus sp. B4I6]|uniref:hypothetical protein n=1 Tax=Neobacillus sp. B4I6 TaxID=3373925 RepID=UPI003D1EC745
MNLQQVEQYFQQQEALMGNLADTESFALIYGLIEKVREQNETIDRVTALNRHYYFKFYNGDIAKMQADFKYLGE